jgi:uncharacterized protein (TIRG00374 family)
LRILAHKVLKKTLTKTKRYLGLNIHHRIQFLFLLFLGFALLYFSMIRIDAAELFEMLSRAHISVAIPVFAVSVFGYYIRSLRWKLILSSMHTDVPISSLFSCLSIGYAVNIATPRLGEVARCLALKKVSHVPLEQSGISVVVERVIDVITLAVIVLLAGIIQAHESSAFIHDQVWLPLYTNIQAIPLWILAAVLLIAGAAMVLIKSKWASLWQPGSFVGRAVQSVKDIVHLRQKGLFVLYTFLIWLCYFLMTFLWFALFDETRELGPYEAFVIMAVGSIGRSVPVQGGGMGAYHYLVSNTFALFGITLVMGNAMAIIIHGAQMILTIVLGLCCWLWMLFKIKNKG